MTAERSGAVAAAFGGLLALAAAMGIGRFALTPILPDMAAALPLSPVAAGAIASANFAGYLAGALAAAVRLPENRRAGLIVALAASALTTAGMAAGDGAVFLGVVRFMGGVASAFVLVLASALVLDRLAKAGRPSLSALHFAGVGCGIAASALVLAVVVGQGGGWRAEWLSVGALAFVAAGLVGMLVPRSEARTGAAALEAGQRGKTGFLRLVVAYGLFGFGYVVTATFITTIVRGDPSLATFELLVWLAVGLAAAPSVALWNRLAQRLGGTAPALALALAVEAAGVAASIVPGSLAALILSALLLGGTFMGVTALGLRAARELSPFEEGRALALVTAAFGLGQIVGPLLAGVLAERTGSFTAPSLAAAGALAIASALAASLHPSRARAATSPSSPANGNAGSARVSRPDDD